MGRGDGGNGYGSVASRGRESDEQKIARAVETYGERRLTPIIKEYERFRTKLETLLGERGASKLNAAVLREELKSLEGLERVDSVDVSGTPTAAQFNVLLKDVKRIQTRLDMIAARLFR